MASSKDPKALGKDKRWIVFGVTAGCVLTLGIGLSFTPYTYFPSALQGTCGMLAIRLIGAAATFIGASGLVVVNSPRVLWITTLFVTMKKNVYKGNQHWNELTGENIVLGAIPLGGSYGHRELIADLNVTAVLSLLEEHEMGAGFVFQPVQPQQWKDVSVEHLWIRTQDFEPVAPEELIRGADFIEAQISKGGKVYVHCKAGRGRSTACVAVFLVKYRGMSVEDALKWIKARRRQIHLNKRQLATIHHAAALLKNE